MVRLPAGAGILFLHHHVQGGSEAHPTLHPMGTGDKASGAWILPLTSI